MFSITRDTEAIALAEREAMTVPFICLSPTSVGVAVKVSL